MKKLQKPAKAYRVDHGKRFRLKDFDPTDIRTFQSQEDASAAFEDSTDCLYAQDCWAVLLLFQGMDAAVRSPQAWRTFMELLNLSATVVNYAARLSWLGRGRLWRANANII
jgi:hypothetical protein